MQPASRWRNVLRDADAVVRADAVTFLIGAGASISSGAPTMGQVVSAFSAQYPDRLPDPDSLRQKSHKITGHEKRTAISSLFDAVNPYVGYRCLAALGQVKRVYVLNLNWDGAVEGACIAVGTRCESVCAEDRSSLAMAVARLPDGKGVLCLHLHGSICVPRFPIRIGMLETAEFPKAVTNFITKHIVPHPFVAVGTTLVDDDILRLLREGTPRDGAGAMPAWLFVRGELDRRHGSAAIELLSARDSSCNLVESEDVDFDELLLALAAAGLDRSYAALRASARLTLGSIDNVAWPNAAVLASALDAPVTLIAGDPYLGKTTTAHLLAYVEHVTRGTSVVLAERGDCTRALASASRATTPTLLVLEDPFGQSESDRLEDSAFLDLLTQVDRSRIRVIVTTRRSVWGAGCRGQQVRDVVVIPEGRSFYDIATLKRYASRCEGDVNRLVCNIDRGELVTPYAVQRAARGLAIPGRGAGENAIIREKLILLRSDPALARLAMLLKLQECHNRPETLSALCDLAGLPEGTIPDFVETLEIDGSLYPRLKHPTDSEAASSALDEPATAALIERNAVKSDWLPRAHRVRQALIAARRGELDVGQWFTDSPDDAREFIPQVVTTHKDPGAALAAVPIDLLDFWTACELAYETARSWNVIRGPATLTWLHAFLGAHAGFGVYALFEASLYLQGGFADELRDHVRSSIHSLVDNPTTTEAAGLVLDALCWRTPPPGTLPNHLLDAFGMPEACDALRAARAFAALFHPDGYSVLFGSAAARDVIDALTPGAGAYFTRLTEWHFLHQCRARALLARRPYARSESHWLVRSFHPQRTSFDANLYREAMLRLRELGADQGWLVHFAVNAGSALGQEGLRDEACEMLESIDGFDTGLATAALTFDGAGRWKAAVLRATSRFGTIGLLSTVFDAPLIWDSRLDRSRFRFCDDVDARLSELGHQWRTLERTGVSNRKELEALLIDTNERHSFAPELRPHVAKVIERVQCGDLRELEALAARGTSGSAVAAALLEAAARLRQEQEPRIPCQGRLPWI